MEIAIITGGSRGLGRSSALHLAQRGVDSLITDEKLVRRAVIVVIAVDDVDPSVSPVSCLELGHQFVHLSEPIEKYRELTVRETAVVRQQKSLRRRDHKLSIHTNILGVSARMGTAHRAELDPSYRLG